jgi:hypothetical protein
MRVQPSTGLRRILLEPRARGAETEAVAPGIHVGEGAFTAAAHAAFILELLRQQDLQIAHRALLGVVTTCVRLETGAAFGCHADVVGRLVQHRMQRRIEPRVQHVAAQTGLAVAPIAAGNAAARRHQLELQAVTAE